MRTLKIAVMAMMLLTAHSFSGALAKEKKVKVCFYVPDVAQGESYAPYLGAQMQLLDEANDSYQYEWVTKAVDAEFIITVLADRNKYPVIIEEGNPPKTCYQYLLIVQVWKKGSDMTHDGLNIQLDCDQNEAAKRQAMALEKAMGLKSGELSRR